MKTIALIHPKIDFEENYPCNWLPFSVLSIGSALPKGRFQVRIFDEHCVSAEQICQSLADDDLFIIGISIRKCHRMVEASKSLPKKNKLIKVPMTAL